MDAPGSVTNWLLQLKAGKQEAAHPLWERYFHQMVGLARSQLRANPRRVADEEDVAVSAFAKFCQAAQGGRFPQLNDRKDLWALLLLLTAQKAVDALRKEKAQKRPPAPQGEADLDRIIGREPTPEFAAQVADECRRLLESLPDDDLRAVALGKMEGYTSAEIAARLGCVERTVERQLGVIRRLWRAAEDNP
jgi:RNA polymerase sigma factor (sigma-70 family)